MAADVPGDKCATVYGGVRLERFSPAVSGQAVRREFTNQRRVSRVLEIYRRAIGARPGGEE